MMGLPPAASTWVPVEKVDLTKGPDVNGEWAWKFRHPACGVEWNDRAGAGHSPCWLCGGTEGVEVWCYGARPWTRNLEPEKGALL